MTAACVPWFIQSQPSMSFRVSIDTGEPAAGVTLHFARVPTCFGCRNEKSWLDEMTADSSGSVAVHWRREFQLVFLVPDAGPLVYRWSWCIDGPGLAPSFRNNFESNAVTPQVAVTLQRSSDRKKCTWINNKEFAALVQ
jgi:hypothetical protein